jgi:hypothetical protein
MMAAKRAKKPVAGERAEDLLKWFQSRWGRSGGCGVAEVARRYLRTAVKGGLSVEQTWEQAPPQLRRTFVGYTTTANGWNDMTLRTEEGLGQIQGSQYSAEFKRALKAERLRLLRANPVLTGMKRIKNGLWVPRWRAPRPVKR